jgi:hypothetical protein
MIDMEALADTPDSAPAEIALVFFDRDSPATPFAKHHYEPSPISAIRLGFIVTTATLQWWDDQGMTIAVQQGEPLQDVLDEITTAIGRSSNPKTLRVWSRGNSYDLAILKLAYQRTGKPLPWHFWLERDVRTWLEGCQFKSPRRNKHSALADATNQAEDVVQATHSGYMDFRAKVILPTPRRPATVCPACKKTNMPARQNCWSCYQPLPGLEIAK